jgi:hypothetical protein
MREFVTAFGDKVDLDDPATYKHLPQEKDKVLERLYQEVGYAHLYIMGKKWERLSKEQVRRVRALTEEISKFFGWDKNMWNESTIFWQEKLFIFLDEIENMC